MSLRFRLATTAIAVIVVANSLLSFVVLQYLGHVWLDEVQTRVQRNLNSARAAYQNRIDVMAAFLDGTSGDPRLQNAVARGNPSDAQPILDALSASGRMDFVVLLDRRGVVLCRGGSTQRGDDLAADPLVQAAMKTRQTATGTVVLSRDRLMKENDRRIEQTRFELLPTVAERPTEDHVRFAGMAMAAAVPVLDEKGDVAGLLYGSSLLARRYEMVDAIKRQVFPVETYQGKETGTVTIFEGDLRIATNVIMEDGTRAVGTRLSESVCDAVLDRGGAWAAPAFVVNDWYITAYEPIRDPSQKVIGVLYVGLLQAPFLHQRNMIFLVFLGVVVAATLTNLVLLFLANELVLSPIRHVVAMAQRVIGGDLSARVGLRPPGEMGVLCRAIDSMAHAVAEREELVRLATQQQIGRTEQLASVGRLAAGVAHEINNPLTGVLAFADLLREKENLDEQDREDITIIIRETKRAREIVRGLLDFARETPSLKALLNINDVVRATLQLLGNREAFQNIYIVEDLAEGLPLVNGDKNQLQQVLLNLALNACQAMPDGGTLMVRSSHRDGRVAVEVTDTGCGIKRDKLDQVFQPFYTTKPVGKGTGLGLSVSYGIVQQHDGSLEVESVEGKGSTFTVTLPAADPGPG